MLIEWWLVDAEVRRRCEGAPPLSPFTWHVFHYKVIVMVCMLTSNVASQVIRPSFRHTLLPSLLYSHLTPSITTNFLALSDVDFASIIDD